MSTATAVRKTYSIPESARLIGIGKARAYEMAKNGEMPGVLKVDALRGEAEID